MVQLCSRKSGSHYARPKPYWHIKRVFQGIDSYGKELPAFNLKGETHINTTYGGLLTLAISICTITYTLITFQILWNRDNPDLNVVTSVNHFTGYDRVNLNEINYRMAFVVESFDDKKTRHDPRYIKYIARLWEEKDGE